MQHCRVWSRRFALAICFASWSLAPARAAGPQPLDFSRDIRPILSNNCFKCHGPDEKKRQAGLRLDKPEGATAELDSGAKAIVPGNVAASALVARINSADADEQMPPPASGKTLKPEEIEKLTRWIEAGAEYPRPLVVPAARAHVAPPLVKHEALVRNPIDRFVLARLEAEGLEPAPPADKVTLVRRVTFDLTGLPPTPAEVDAFLADTSTDAYEAARRSAACARRATASTWPATGSTRPATATRTACTSTTSGRSGNIANG